MRSGMSETVDFDALVAEFYQVWFRFHPSAALFAGVAGYEGQLAADGDDDVGALAGWLGNLLAGALRVHAWMRLMRIARSTCS